MKNSSSLLFYSPETKFLYLKCKKKFFSKKKLKNEIIFYPRYKRKKKKIELML